MKTRRESCFSRLGGWIYNMDGVQRVLYKLPELIAEPLLDWVFVVEGEKDVDRLLQEGLPATTNPGGAGKWLSCYNEYFRGRLVAIIPDNDEPGRRHAKMVAEAIADDARRSRLSSCPDYRPKET